MSRKAGCPSCESWNSQLAEIVFGDSDDPCRTCGLPAETIREIHHVREKHANDQVTTQFETLAIRAGHAEARAERLQRQLDAIRALVGGGDDVAP